MAQTSYDRAIRAAIAGLRFGDPRLHEMESAVNADVGNMPFGIAAAIKGSGTDQATVLPAAGKTSMRGVVCFAQEYERQIPGVLLEDGSGNPGGDLSDTGLVPGAQLELMVKGRVWVPCEEAIVYGDRLRVRLAANGGFTQVGTFRKTAVAGQTVDTTAQVKAVGATIAAPAGLPYAYLAPVEVNFMNVGGAAD